MRGQDVLATAGKLPALRGARRFRPCSRQSLSRALTLRFVFEFQSWGGIRREFLGRRNLGLLRNCSAGHPECRFGGGGTAEQECCFQGLTTLPETNPAELDLL